MRIRVSSLTDAVGAEARAYAEEKAGRLGRWFRRLERIELVLDAGKDHRFRAEVIVHPPRRPVVVCRAEAATATAALDEALDKMDRTLRKLKERARSLSGRRRLALPARLAG